MNIVNHSETRLTLKEFQAFANSKPANERWELLGGLPLKQQTPSEHHQAICMEFLGTLYNYFKHKECTPYGGRDVILSELENNFYIPDALVLCNKSLDDGQTIHGAPTLVMEVWSPANRRNERSQKRRDYLSNGVKELWEFTVDDDIAICSNAFEDGHVSTQVYFFNEEMESLYFPGLVFNMSDLSSFK